MSKLSRCRAFYICETGYHNPNEHFVVYCGGYPNANGRTKAKRLTKREAEAMITWFLTLESWKGTSRDHWTIHNAVDDLKVGAG